MARVQKQADANALVALRPGQRIAYHGWRGDSGTGVFLAHLREDETGPLLECSPIQWQIHKRACLRIQRDGFVGPTTLYPFIDGDEVAAFTIR